MSLWILNIVLLFAYTIIIKGLGISRNKQNMLLIKLMFIQLLFLYVFKDSYIFNDLWAYIEGFKSSVHIPWNDLHKSLPGTTYLEYELGWRYYVKLLSSISENEFIMIFFTGGIILYSHFKLISKYSHVYWFSIFLFISLFYYYSMFVLRQNLAVAVCLFAIPYIIERKVYKFIFLVVIAYFIHKSAIIFLVLYFLYPMKLDRKLIISLVLIVFIISYIFQIILEYSIFYLKFSSLYLDMPKTGNSTSFIISLILVLYVGYILKIRGITSDEEKLFFIMLLLTAIFDFLEIGKIGIFSRVGGYFQPSIIILLPNISIRYVSPLIKYISIAMILIVYTILSTKSVLYGFKLGF